MVTTALRSRNPIAGNISNAVPKYGYLQVYLINQQAIRSKELATLKMNRYGIRNMYMVISRFGIYSGLSSPADKVPNRVSHVRNPEN